jgi:predicted  nucleic acid-binding Zn-ribbon protein
MLIAAFVAMFFSSTGNLFDQEFIEMLNRYTKESITEPQRQKGISAHMDAIEDELEAFSDRLKGAAKRMVKLNNDHTSTRKEFATVLAELNQQRLETQIKMMELRFKVKAQMTRGEWRAALGQ